MPSRMLWHTQTEWLSNSTLCCRIFRETHPLSFSEVLSGWRDNEAFADFFSHALMQAPFSACFWEMPALTTSSLDRVFECVLIDSPSLVGVSPEPGVFAAYFDSTCDVVSFDNLGGDALLLTPCPAVSPADYSHLLGFLRNAPPGQLRALWKMVARSLQARLSDKPVWLSTSGLGVYWLHIRLDDQPKYYQHAPYRKFARLDP